MNSGDFVWWPSPEVKDNALQGSRAKFRGQSAGVTGALSYFRMTLAEGRRAIGRRVLRLGPRSFDGLAPPTPNVTISM